MTAVNLTSNTVTTILFVLVILAIGMFGKSFFTPKNDENEKRKISSHIVTLIIVIIVVILILATFGFIIWGQQGWLGVVYFALSVLGSVAKWIWDAIKASKNNNPPVLNFYALVPALIFSPIVYNALLANLATPAAASGNSANPGELLAPFILAFQNGFFWQTVYDQIVKKA